MLKESNTCNRVLHENKSDIPTQCVCEGGGGYICRKCEEHVK